MTFAAAERNELNTLLDAMLGEGFGEPQRVRLNEILRADHEAQHIYCEYLAIHVDLALRAQAQTGAVGMSKLVHETQQGMLSADETPPPAKADVPHSRAAGSPILGFLGDTLGRGHLGPVSPGLVVAATVAALSVYFVGLLIMVAMHHARSDKQSERLVAEGPAIAQLVESTRCVWRTPDNTKPESQVEIGQSLELVSGIAVVHFNSGVDTTVVGPSALKFLSAGLLKLQRGKVIARVPQRAVGFTVETEFAQIVDLGTEFGVEVDEQGLAEVHMLEGAAEVRTLLPPGDETAAPALSRRLKAGEAVRITSGRSIEVLPVELERFSLRPSRDQALGGETLVGQASGGQVLDPLSGQPQGGRPGESVQGEPIPGVPPRERRLDVVDLVCGGNGRGHRRGVAVDPASGKFGVLPFTNRQADGQYHLTPNHPVLDGAFMPNGTIQIDSSGNQFKFPKTSAYTWDLIRAGGEIFGTTPGQRASEFGGIDYSRAPHGFLTLLPNCGLTLDLATLRQRLKAGICGFTTRVGNSDAVDRNPKADFFVIVDGQSRFERRGFTIKETPFEVYVSLGESDHFLTIASSDGGDGSGGDWIVLGDPVMEMCAP